MPQTIRVLLIEDNAPDAELLSDYLSDCSQAEITVEWVNRLSLGLEFLANNTVDVVVLDMNLPDSKGAPTLSRALEVAPKVPFVVLSGHDDEMAAVEAVQLGAQDYLVKGSFDGDLLFRAIRYAIERKILQEQAFQRLVEAEQAEARLAAALGSMNEGFCQVDRLGRISYMNSAGLSLIGQTSESVLNKNIHDLVHTDADQKREKSTCAMCEAIAQGLPFANSDDQFFMSDGQTIPVEYSLSPFSFQGQIIGSVLCFRNITERKVAEIRVKEFYSTVSHELRTPLTSVRGSLSLMRSGVVGDLTPETTELVELALGNCNQLIQLISDILDLRKIEENKLELDFREQESESLVTASIDAVRGMAAEAGVQLAQRFRAGSDCKVVADRNRIIQVLTNLLSNAIKYSYADNTVVVEVTEATDAVRFAVIDQGEGIPENQLHKLFQKFQQVNSTDSRPKPGTGLGLIISKSIVEQHGGEIGVESVFGSGSTFWFKLPRAMTSDSNQQFQDKCASDKHQKLDHLPDVRPDHNGHQVSPQQKPKSDLPKTRSNMGFDEHQAAAQARH